MDWPAHSIHRLQPVFSQTINDSSHLISRCPASTSRCLKPLAQASTGLIYLDTSQQIPMDVNAIEPLDNTRLTTAFVQMRASANPLNPCLDEQIDDASNEQSDGISHP